MFGFSRFHRWRQYRLLRKHRIPAGTWKQVVSQVPVLQTLKRREQHRLRKLSSLFLHDKTFHGGAGLEIDDFMRASIAAQACLLVLNLDLRLYNDWSEIIVYPDAFIAPQTETDAAGVVHESKQTLGGQAWHQGPVVLAWSDIQQDMQDESTHKGSNVVLHEFAHKLDFLNGAANGMPPLHQEMKRAQWTHEFSAAYDDLIQRIHQRKRLVMNPYAATDPAEFFAVMTEVYFEDPQRLQQRFTGVYQKMSEYYQQDPLSRIADNAAIST